MPAFVLVICEYFQIFGSSNQNVRGLPPASESAVWQPDMIGTGQMVMVSFEQNYGSGARWG